MEKLSLIAPNYRTLFFAAPKERFALRGWGVSLTPFDLRLCTRRVILHTVHVYKHAGQEVDPLPNVADTPPPYR